MKLSTLFPSLLIALPVWAQIDSLEIKMNGMFQKYNGGPGLAAGIVKDGKVIFKKGYGMANLEYDVPISSSTVFDIASVSKQFAGLAISTLVQDGKISVQDDIRKYLPEVPDFGKTITINHLLHHMSGLRDWPEALNVAGWRWDEAFSFSDIIRMVKKQKELDFEPGAKYSYSNTGYNLLALIVEKVTKQTFREWTDAHIFSPLQMTSSHFQDDYSKITKNMAYSYWRDGNEFHKEMTGLTALGSSSLFTNVDDLCKWVINFSNRVDAKDPIYLRMLEDGVMNNGDKTRYGYGLALGDLGGMKTVDHTGGWAGYRTVIMNFPDEKVSIILLGNIGEFYSYGSAIDVAKIILKGKLKEEQRDDVVKMLPAIKLREDLAQLYAGTYQLGENWFVTLTLENGNLMTQANGEDKFPTQAKSDSVIWIDAYKSAMTFMKGKDGKVNMLRYRKINAKRVTPLKPDPASFKQFVGTYYSEELSAEYKIDLIDGKLMMHHMRLGDFELKPDIITRDTFDSGVGALKFFKDKGKVGGFRLSRGRIKNILFVQRRD
jgi:CubicO group peptidase (beta-lactamase class C family)